MKTVVKKLRRLSGAKCCCLSDPFLGALCPSKSGLMNKHIVKHIVVIGCMNIFKRMSRTLAEAGPTLRMTLFMGEAAQASH